MDNEIPKELLEIAQKHTVDYQVWPHYDMVAGREVMDGFDLELHGTHDHGKTRLAPGCPVCVDTFQDLHRIAEWILPKDWRPSQYEIPPFDSSLHASPNETFEVVLTIKIEHRHDFDQPVDDCEKRCLAEMQEKLNALGARRHRHTRSR
jgi:hypothetical protein